MQKIASFILILAFMGQTFNQGLYHVGYLLNKAEYAKNCINKARPMMHCNGKCQLMKKIAEQEKKEREEAPELKLAKNEVLSSKSSFLLQVTLFGTAARKTYVTFDNRKTVDRPVKIFHPPGCLG